MTGTYGPVLNTHAVCCEDYYFPEVKFKLFIVCITRRTGRTIRKVMGGGGVGVGEKNKKKFMQGKMPRKKIHAEGRSNCDFFRKSEFQKSTILPGTI